jgi:hypothetical protein
VVAPKPAALAQACVEVTADAALAERLGSQGQRDIAALTWPNTVKKLVLA